jgi:N-acetylglucosaminyldiphosphoundecaprenol N-acetyl-beta-D-mannosaminyltransferase
MTQTTRDLFGVPVAAITMDKVLGLVDEAVTTRRPLQIGVVNAAKLVNIQRDTELRADVLSLISCSPTAWPSSGPAASVGLAA